MNEEERFLILYSLQKLIEVSENEIIFRKINLLTDFELENIIFFKLCIMGKYSVKTEHKDNFSGVFIFSKKFCVNTKIQ